MSNARKQQEAKILGMSFGTACGRLRRLVMLHLLQRHGENVCFKCGKLILRVEELTLEHKQPWRAGGATLFWDLDNIAFSHARCNLRTGWVKREVIAGMLWCSACKQSRPTTYFHKETRQRTGYAVLCKDCANAKRRKIKAQGDCQRCGAKRGTRPFRGTHNICLSCHDARQRTYSKQQQAKMA